MAETTKRKLPRGANLDADTSKALAEVFRDMGNIKVRINYREMQLEISGDRRDDTTRIPLK